MQFAFCSLRSRELGQFCAPNAIERSKGETATNFFFIVYLRGPAIEWASNWHTTANVVIDNRLCEGRKEEEALNLHSNYILNGLRAVLVSVSLSNDAIIDSKSTIISVDEQLSSGELPWSISTLAEVKHNQFSLPRSKHQHNQSCCDALQSLHSARRGGEKRL